MKVHNVHSRQLAAPAERIGAVLDSLGGEQDSLWPSDRWPALPFELDGPLSVGARGGHGPIRYAVEAYEPGRRLVFGFAPGLGLDGTHQLDVEPLGPNRSRLTHTLDCLVEPKLLALWPIVRGYHNALIEDLLDRAELAATGRHAPPRSRPIWLRFANGTEVRVARWRGKLPAATPARAPELGARTDRLARIGRAMIPATLAALAALHAAWALGWRWPGGSDSELAERVVGAGAELPPAGATWAVAALLLVAATTVRIGAAGVGGPVRAAAWGVSGVFVARGLLFIPIDIARGVDDIYERLDLAVYSPLCLVLGGGTAWLLMRATGHVRGNRVGAVGAGQES